MIARWEDTVDLSSLFHTEAVAIADKLTDAEEQAFWMLRSGYDRDDIARKQLVSRDTVDKRISQVKRAAMEVIL